MRGFAVAVVGHIFKFVTSPAMCVSHFKSYLKTFTNIFLNVLWFLFEKQTYERSDYSDEEIEKGDEYIDKLLKDMFENRVEEYDPYVIEDSSVGFYKKVSFVNVSGVAMLHDGYITGLKTLHRPNHCSLEEKGDRLNVKADLGAGELKFHYSGSVKFMNIGPTITVHGNLEYVEVHIEFDVDAETGKDGILRKFIIDDMRGMKVWITGLGPINWAVNPIISGVTKTFKSFVRKLLGNRVRKHIAERIPDFQFPVEGETGQPTEPPTVDEPTESTEATEVEVSDDETEAEEEGPIKSDIQEPAEEKSLLHKTEFNLSESGQISAESNSDES